VAKFSLEIAAPELLTEVMIFVFLIFTNQRSSFIKWHFFHLS